MTNPRLELIQMLRGLPTSEDIAFGSRRYYLPRQKLVLDVNQSAMTFFKRLSLDQNAMKEWEFVDFQHYYRKLDDTEYTELLHYAIDWCKNNCDDSGWEISGNDFLFRNKEDAASFIWNIFD